MQCCNNVEWSDVAYRQPDRQLAFRWPALFGRLDPIVNNGIKPVVVLDNVDFAFLHNTSSIGKYGQNLGPDNVTEYAEGFIAPLAEQLVARYGASVVSNSFWFRVGTEPNTRPGHWADTTQKYIDEYIAVAHVLRRVIGPSVAVGPGNFCPFYQPNSGCNSTLDTVVDPIVRALATQSTFSFLGESFYGNAGGCPPTPGDNDNATLPMTHTRPSPLPTPPSRACGYEPNQAALAAEGLRYLRDTVAGPAYANVPMQFHEYGTLGNAQGRISPEPGAFGGAWTLATSTTAAQHGVSRAFHWANHDNIGPGNASTRLYYSNAWLSAMMGHLFGTNTSAGSLYVLEPTVSSDDPIAVETTENIEPTQAYGVGGPAAVSAGQDGLGFLVTLFSADKHNHAPAAATVTFPCGTSGDLSVTARVLNTSTGTYDVLRADAAQRGWLAYPTDDEVYQVSLMLNTAGKAALGTASGSAMYRDVQARVFAPVPNATAAGVTVSRSSSVTAQCALHITASPPAVLAVSVVWATD
eukprot:m.224171 g.224171  ORF g.224171 m.224171 type:complete len:523 (-) comp34078_c0_seq1:56-1624(-)